MSIGSNIKRLRKENNITQEQLAEYLGITSRAISQWECGRTSPDITLIPALCHIFNVSSDELLGIDIQKSNDEIKKYLEEATELKNQGKWEEQVNLLSEANKKFPRDYKIMLKLANAFVNEYSRKRIKEYDQVFELCNRILEECTDSNIRYEATDTLAIAYGYAGKKDEMLRLAKEMPKSHFSYENFMLFNWNGKGDLAEIQEYISYLINQLICAINNCCGFFENGKKLFSNEERMKLLELQVELLEALFPDKDYQLQAQLGEIACSHIATMLIRENNIKGAWHYLEKAVDFAIHMDTYDFNAPHTSLILRGYSSGGWIMESNGNHSQCLLEWLTTDEEASILRFAPRYKQVINRLKEVAIKP
ncbi:MAG: helix-turn-helix domain-containing protein [Clostridia bacterium]|nr:helix-turn-helix domain-containing protein [Clostridia bacterium]